MRRRYLLRTFLLAASGCFNPDGARGDDGPAEAGTSMSSADATSAAPESDGSTSTTTETTTPTADATTSPDTSTSTDVDASSSSSSDATSAGPTCRDGDAEPGELCFDVVAIAAPSGLARGAQLGDLDGDSVLDIVYLGAEGVQIIRGAGDGTFEDPLPGPLVTGNNLALGFVNAGPDPDVLIAHAESPGDALLHPGSKGLSFGALASAIGPGTSPSALVALADLDGDGDDDAVVGGRDNVAGSLLSARAEAGGLTETGPVFGTHPIWGLAVADVSGDGDPDVVYATGTTTSGLFLRLGDGSGGFEEEEQLDTDAFELRGVALGDLDGDDDMDIVYASASNNTVTVLINGGDASFAEGATLTASTPHAVAIADVTNDGTPDIIVGHASEASVRIFEGVGAGDFNRGSNFDTSSPGAHLSVGDLNGDTIIPDIVATGANTPSLSLLLSNP